jgi:general secretion pathway protein J
MTSSRPCRRRAGFTLLEVVLAMTALAMLTVVCYGAFHLGIRAVQSGEIAVVTSQRLRAATDVLIRQVKSVACYNARNEDDETYPYFFGSADRMTFITTAGMRGGGGLARVVYHVEGDPPELLLTESPIFDPAHEQTTMLLSEFEKLRFRYLLDDGADVEWMKSWDSYEEETMPVAVKIVVEGMRGADGNAWGQEIPLMAPSYNEGRCEVGSADELPQRFDPDSDFDSDS